jgi:hypothetical protein
MLMSRRRAPLTLIAGLSLLAAACAGVRSESDVYATLAEAQAAGAVEAGWVPAGLPAETTDLRNGHTPDGSHWGLFAFPPDRAEPLRALLGSEITAGEPPACDPPGRFEWWPRLLRSPMDAEKIRSAGLQAYRTADGRRTFVVNWRQGKAYYWHQP